VTFNCCRHCVRDSEGACLYLELGTLQAHTHACSICQRGDYLRQRVGDHQTAREKHMPGTCCLCTKPAEVYHPDPNRPGEQVGYCGFHEPEDTDE